MFCKKFVLSISVLFLFSCFAFGQSDSSITVKVGWYESELFQKGMSDDQVKSGYAYDYLQKISDYTTWNYEYVYGNWGDLYEKLVNGEIDFLSGVSKTEERKKQILFPDFQMGSDQYYLYKHASDNSISMDDIKSFKGKKVGGLHNNRITFFTQQWLKAHNAEVEIVYFDGFESQEEAFTKGEIDLIAQPINNVLNMVDLAVIDKVGEETYYLAINKSREDLLISLNEAVDTMFTIDPFILQNLLYKNYGTSLTSSNLSDLEQKWIENHPLITIGFLDSYLPYSSLNENGRPMGLMLDVVSAIMENLSLEHDIAINYEAYTNYDDMINSLRDNKIDIAFPVYENLWELEKNKIKASSAVVSCSESFIYKGSFDKNNVAKVGVNRNNHMQIAYVLENFPKAELYNFDSIEECLSAVLKGTVDGTVINTLRTEIVTGNTKYKSLSSIPLENFDGRCFGVNIDNSALLLMLNRGLRLIGTSYGIENSYKYMGYLYSYRAIDFIRDNLFLMAIIVGTVVTAIIGMLLYILNKKTRNMKEKEQWNKQLQENQNRLEAVNKFLLRQNNIVQSLAHQFTSLYYITMRNYSFIELTSANQRVKEVIGQKGDAIAAFEKMFKYIIYPEYEKELRAFCDLTTINERLKDKVWIAREFRSVKTGWAEGVFIVADRDADGNMLHLIWCTRDINDRKNIELSYQHDLEVAKNHAEAANSAKSSFLFNMSHDIRTPMNAIIGFRDLLEKNQDDAEKRAAYLTKIQDASNVLLSIINNVLEMARIEKGTIEIDNTPWSSEQFNDSIFSIFNEMMQEKNIEFTREIHIKNNYVYCDPIKLREVFVNVISNAYKYTNPGGKIKMVLEELSCDEPGHAIYKTTISDTGIGMSKEFLPHIFEEFSRENTATENKIEGTGLGMSIVKRLVTLMKGTIDVTSEKGVGTTFVIMIPHKIAEKHNRIQFEDVEIDPKVFAGKHILLAEDNEFNAEISIELLEEAGFCVDLVTDGEQAIEKLKNSENGYYNLILMDIQMPKMNGYEATKLIRSMEDKSKAEIPIVAMTANAFEEDKREAIACGMNGHISKPVNFVNLLKELAKTLG